MSYYNTDINTGPAPGAGHTLKTDSFEEWRKKRDAKLAAAGWSTKRVQASAISEKIEIRDRKKLSR